MFFQSMSSTLSKPSRSKEEVPATRQTVRTHRQNASTLLLNAALPLTRLNASTPMRIVAAHSRLSMSRNATQAVRSKTKGGLRIPLYNYPS